MSPAPPPYLYPETNLRELMIELWLLLLVLVFCFCRRCSWCSAGRTCLPTCGIPCMQTAPAGFRCVLLPPWLLDRHVEPRAPLGTCCDPLVSFPDNFSTRLGWGIFLQDLSSVWKWGGLGVGASLTQICMEDHRSCLDLAYGSHAPQNRDLSSIFLEP